VKKFTKVTFSALIISCLVLALSGCGNSSTPETNTTTETNSKAWYPTGYTVDTTLNPDVAYKSVPSAEAGPCTWCSARHGYYYWKVDFIVKNACTNLYINTQIKNSSGVIVGSWYQKGFATLAMTPKRLEVVTHEQDSTYEITQILC
jgi:hypothetical protein